jgi:transposase-like protein
MKRSRYTEEQIFGILREQAAGTPVTELCRKHGMGDAMFYTWKSKYGGLEVNEAKGQAGINRLASMQTPARSRGGLGRRTGLIAWL